MEKEEFLVDNGVLIGYQGEGGAVVIPDGIYSIGGSAFSLCDTLTSVTLPSSLRWIGQYAFAWCKHLSSVTIPAGVTRISEAAFLECKALTAIAIPEKVATIGKQAFFGCDHLTSLTFAENGRLASLGKGAFACCKSLTSVTLPPSLTSIGDDAFSWCDELTSVTIGEGVTTIGNEAFAYCRDLLSVTIPASVTEVGESAFEGCRSLEAVDVKGRLDQLGDRAFARCYVLRRIDMTAPTNVSGFPFISSPIVPSWEFARCKNQSIKEESVLLWLAQSDRILYPEYLTYLKRKKEQFLSLVAGRDDVAAFAAMTEPPIGIRFGIGALDAAIESVGGRAAMTAALLEYKRRTYDQALLDAYAIRQAESVFGERALPPAEWRKVFELKKKGSEYEIVRYIGNAGEVGIPAVIGKFPVTSIGDKAFMHSGDLTGVTIPFGVTRIGASAFSGCRALTEVEISATVTDVGEAAFSYCDELTSLTVAEGNPRYHSENGCLIETETRTLVAGCRASVIPSSVTSIGDSAFCGCASLTAIEIPAGVTSIGDSAFYECKGLIELEIPQGVTRIGGQAFCGCAALTALFVPSSVTEIDNGVIGRCPSLRYTDHESCAYLGDSENPYLILVKVSDKTITQCRINERTRFIYNSAFWNCSQLTEVTVPPSVRSIGRCAFEQCESLRSITIPQGVTRIESSTFQFCKKLESITLPASVTEVESNAFDSCYALETVNVEGKLDRLATMAFFDCRSLRRVRMSRPRKVGGDPFLRCPVIPAWEMAWYGNQVVQDASVILRLADADRPIEQGYLAYLDRNKRRLLYQMAEKDDVPLFAAITDASVGIRFDIGELDTAIDAAAGRAGMTAALLEYKHRTYSRQRIDAYAKDRQDKALGVKEYTAADWRRVFTLRKRASQYVITRYDGRDTVLHVPAVIGSTPVTRIAPRAFEESRSLTEVVLPEGLTDLGPHAFFGCRSLRAITLPSTLRRIGSCPFFFCGALSSITYAGTVSEWTAIDRWADWAADLPVTKVNCSDGDVPLTIM